MEVLTCAKLNVHFTKCFEGQVPYLCTREFQQLSRDKTGFPIIVELDTCMLKAYLRNINIHTYIYIYI